MNGQVIGNYKIESKLGEGGMGAVYKGVDTMLDREVAIKALRPELASQTSIVERFRSEAVTLAKLHHPNIATLYSLFRHGNELYMVLEYVRGETLDQIIARRGALAATEVIPVFAQILDGINHAHEYGIVHRDIKPANMMLTEKGTLKVLDFGIARLLGTNRMTRAGSIIGTLEYMAPEQVKGLETDARTDIYALGMMLYEMLTGRAPFNTENEFELMMLQIDHLPPPPRSINPSIPPPVEAAIMRAIQKDPNARFQTAAEFRESLLAAGYATQGAMLRRGNTGDRQSQQETAHLSSSGQSNGDAPISRPNFDEATVPLPSQKVIKETRLGGGSEASSSAGAVAAPLAASLFAASTPVKETRLGGAAAAGITNAQPSSQTGEMPASFFSQLNWIHYAGAGFVATMLLGLLIIVPLFIFSGSGGKNNSADSRQSKSDGDSANGTIQNKEVKTPIPTPTPAAGVSAPIVDEERSAAPLQTPIPIPTPDSTGAANTTAGTTRRAANPTPPARTPRPSPTRKRTPKPEPDADCLLSGDC